MPENDVIIRAEDIGKRYVLNHQTGTGGSYRKFSDVLVHAAKAPLRWFQRPNSDLPSPISQKEDFWALKDINFEIKRGEVVGIIGRNGAGKSTLLKILSRITEPTTGRITLRGRVASLLEVGTGFHPELTGRENIYLNGAILGMTKAEIRSKFDEIVAFAEIEKFLDTPVKRYSSGMYVRLAFAVAAHLEPEILIVDEVLAVGDAQFQKKCLGKMQDVAHGGGRTVLFVSHNMGAVNALCSRGILMQRGSIIAQGATEKITTHYLGSAGGSANSAVWTGDAAVNRGGVTLLGASIVKSNGEAASSLECGEPFAVKVSYQIHKPKRGVRAGYRLETSEGVVVFGINDGTLSETRELTAGCYEVVCQVGQAALNSGSYAVTVGLDEPPYNTALFLEQHCLFFQVEDIKGEGSNYVRPPGIIRPRFKWLGPT